MWGDMTSRDLFLPLLVQKCLMAGRGPWEPQGSHRPGNCLPISWQEVDAARRAGLPLTGRPGRGAPAFTRSMGEARSCLGWALPEAEARVSELRPTSSAGTYSFPRVLFDTCLWSPNGREGPGLQIHKLPLLPICSPGPSVVTGVCCCVTGEPKQGWISSLPRTQRAWGL